MKYTKWIFRCLGLMLCVVGCKNSSISNIDKIEFLNSHYGCISNDWQFQYQGAWYPATVPGNIHDDLLHNHLIADPHFGTNEDSVQWISDSTWTYRLIFDKNCAQEKDFKHQELVFEGLDTYAEIFLNGELLKSNDGTTSTDNMFRRWRFDVTDKLKKKNNELLVRFVPSTQRDSLAKLEVPFTMPDTRVFTRKAQYMQGWDWGPTLNTCGIWKNVYIHHWNNIKGEALFFKDTKPTLDSSGVWEGDLYIEVYAEKEARVKLHVELFGCAQTDSVYPSFITTRGVRLQEGKNRIKVPLKIRHPKLWWPNGMGEQNLYQCNVYCSHKGKKYEIHPSVNERALLFGLRTIDLKREKDSIGESFEFFVNGKPCFLRGANWIPATSYPGILSRPEGKDVYYQRLYDAKVVNMNMIRVWGGGLYEDDAFYSYCDQMGLLVWQDFMYACNPYPGDVAFLKNAEIEATEQIDRLRNHPCIAIWCGNNEVHNGLEDWGWQEALHWTADQNKKLYHDFHHLFDTILPNVLAKETHNMAYISSSPTFGWGHEECCTHGCSHFWGVWWGDMPFSTYWKKTGRFMTEYGFQSYPEMATWNSCTEKSERYLESASLKNHQKHSRGVEIIQEAMKQDFGYNKTQDLEAFAYVSQLVQANGITQAIDAHRIQQDICRGTLYWQLNDCWTVASWSSIDYLGRWKALHYRLKDLYANVSLMIHQNIDQSIDFYVVNNEQYAILGAVSYEIINIQGKGKQPVQVGKNVTVLPNTSQKVLSLSKDDVGTMPLQEVCARVAFGTKEKVYAQRVAYFVKPKDLLLVQQVPQHSVKYFDDRVEITFTSQVLQYGVFISESTGKFISWSDNYFDILPNEPITITGYYNGATQEKPKFKILSFQLVK